MRAVGCAVLLFIATAPVAHSQEPTPSAPESRQHEQAQPQSPQEPSGTQKQAAPQPPIIVNVLPPQKTEAELAEERHEREEKSGLERRLVDYTWGLFIATIVLAAATVLLVGGTGAIAYFGWHQSKDTKSSIDIAPYYPLDRRSVKPYVAW